MVVLGLLLILLVALVLTLVLAGGANDPAILILGTVKWNTSAATMFLAGAATVVVLAAGVGLLQMGLRRARQRRKGAKEDRLSAQAQAREQEKGSEDA
jgi:uncharacterized membrane protein